MRGGTVFSLTRIFILFFCIHGKKVSEGQFLSHLRYNFVPSNCYISRNLLTNSRNQVIKHQAK